MKFFAAFLLLALFAGTAKAEDVWAQIVPLQAQLSFLSDAQFVKTCSKDDLACVWTPGCRIFLRASASKVWGRPEDGQAGFSSSQLPAEIAHELLHCLRGAWHPDQPSTVRKPR